MSSKGSYILDHKLKVKSEDLIYHVHEYDADLESNHIYLFGREEYKVGAESEEDTGEPGIEYTIANRFIRNLNLCMRANPDKPILVHMKTCGGDWAEGMAIYNAIKSCPNPVTILNYTHARSMSSLIFLAANKRVMMPDSKFMFHQGTMGFSGTTKQFLNEAGELLKTDIRMVEIYVDALKEQGKYKKWSKKRIEEKVRALMDKKEEVYLTEREALDWGFADLVFGDEGYNWKNLIDYTDEQLER